MQSTLLGTVGKEIENIAEKCLPSCTVNKYYFSHGGVEVHVFKPFLDSEHVAMRDKIK